MNVDVCMCMHVLTKVLRISNMLPDWGKEPANEGSHAEGKAAGT